MKPSSLAGAGRGAARFQGVDHRSAAPSRASGSRESIPPAGIREFSLILSAPAWAAGSARFGRGYEIVPKSGNGFSAKHAIASESGSEAKPRSDPRPPSALRQGWDPGDGAHGDGSQAMATRGRPTVAGIWPRLGRHAAPGIIVMHGRGPHRQVKDVRRAAELAVARQDVGLDESTRSGRLVPGCARTSTSSGRDARRFRVWRHPHAMRTAAASDFSFGARRR